MKKDTIIKGIVVSTSLAAVPENADAFSLSEFINESNVLKEDSLLKRIFFANVDENNKDEKVSKKATTNSTTKKTRTVTPIVEDSVLEITLGEGDNIQDIEDNPNGYETVKVTTTGSRKLTVKDFRALNNSTIPNIDLSKASAENIPDKAFYNNKELKTFKFPKELLVISENAFNGCSSLTMELQIPNTVTTIEGYAFNGCSGLTGEENKGKNFIIPDTVTYIGESAFKGCTGFKGGLTLPANITIINEATFDGCMNLTGQIVIPENVLSIEKSAFRNCSKLTGSLTIPNKVTKIGQNAFYSCKSLSGNLILGTALKTIESSAFYGCEGLTGNLNIPNTVTTIGKSAFQKCSGLNGNLTIPESVTKIDSLVFADCKSLTGELNLHDKITSIGAQAFQNCKKLTGDLTIPNSVTELGASAFSGCSGFDGSLTISTSIKAINSFVFDNCYNLTGDLVIPGTVTKIGEGAFNECAGFDGILSIPETVTEIGDEAFYKCTGLTGDLNVPKSITKIGNKAFYGCLGFDGALTMGEAVESIGDDAFGECRSLSGNLVLPTSLTHIGAQAFINCHGFVGDVFIPNSIETLGVTPFIGMDNPEFIIAVNEKYVDSNYREDVINALVDFLDTESLHIEVPYEFNVEKTWLKNIDQDYIKKPILHETDTYINLEIPTPFKESNVKVTKDGKDYQLPTSEGDGSYKFRERGEYTVVLITDLGTKSTINFKVATPVESSHITYENGILTIKENPNNPDIKFKYRINGGEWKDYSTSFMLESQERYVKLEVKVIVDEATGDEYIIESNIEMHPATINASDITVKLGSTFKEKEGVTATDIDGTVITDKIEVKLNEVNTNAIGEYRVTYAVEGKNKYTAEKTITVKVVGPVINASDRTINVGDTFDVREGVTATDSTGKDITARIEIKENKVDNRTPGIYPVTYEVKEDAMVVTKSIFVTVAAKDNTGNNNGNGTTNNGAGNSGAGNNNATNAQFTIKAEDVTVALNSNFKTMDHIKVLDLNGQDVTSNATINIVANTVDTTKVGVYKVSYQVTYLEKTLTKDIKVTVQNSTSNNGTTTNGTNDTTANGSNGTTGNTGNTQKPQTGDTSLGIYVGLAVASATGLVLNRKKKK